MKKFQLKYVVERFLDAAGKIRFIVAKREVGVPSVCLSMFEHELMMSGRSPNTTSKSLFELAYLYTWADLLGLQLDAILLDGSGLSEMRVRQFSHWLRERNTHEGEQLKAKTFNSILTQCARFCIWCGKWESSRPTGRNASHINQIADQNIRNSWKSRTIRVRQYKVAPDLDESEIKTLEQHLKPKVSINRGESPDVAYRNYLIWHLAIEMGLRISEILALRLEDCPCYGNDYIKIVRIEERGKGYTDPRGVYAPRPKTLSRDLGFIISNSPLRKVLQEYISKYRYRKLQGGGKQFLLEHDFLILTHNSGRPLSNSSASAIAVDIAARSEIINFHWHITRHAFFNRAYSAVVANESHLNDLIYYGGWSDAKSLNIYAQRAIRNRSIQFLSVWQHGNQWDALTN